MPEIALPELIFYALLFLTIALAFAARKLTQAFFGWLISALSSIPVIGGKLAAPFAGAERAIVSACGSIESGCDRIMGATWHATARLMDWTWREIRSHAVALAQIATPLGALLTLYHGLRALLHQLTHVAHGVTAGVKTLEREYHGIEHRVRTLEREIGAGIGHDVIPRLHILEKEWGRFRNKTLPAIEGDIAAIPQDIADWVEGIPTDITKVDGKAFAGAVAAALGALGLGALNCLTNRNFLSKWACGLGGLLDAIIGLMISALALESVCATLPILETAFGDVVGPITHLLTEVPLGGCETPPTGWASLSVKMGPVPPPQTLGSLPV